MKFYFDELDATGVDMLKALVDAGVDFAVYYDSDSEAMILEVKASPKRKIFVEPPWLNPKPYEFPMISYGSPNKTTTKYTYTVNPSTAKYTLDDQ